MSGLSACAACGVRSEPMGDGRCPSCLRAHGIAAQPADSPAPLPSTDPQHLFAANADIPLPDAAVPEPPLAAQSTADLRQRRRRLWCGLPFTVLWLAVSTGGAALILKALAWWSLFGLLFIASVVAALLTLIGEIRGIGRCSGELRRRRD